MCVCVCFFCSGVKISDGVEKWCILCVSICGHIGFEEKNEPFGLIFHKSRYVGEIT